MRKIAALLSIALLISLVGCNGSATVDDVPSSNSIESPQSSSSLMPEETQSMVPTQDPSQSEEPEETTQAPLESEDLPEETIAPTVEPTSDPSSAPSPSSSPVHTHSYTSTITKPATCVDGVRTFTCSCGDSYTEVIKATGNHNYSSTVTKQATCAEEGIKTYTCSTCGNKYNETIGKTNDHKWETKHFDEYGYYVKGETHMVTFKRCDCGFEVNSDMPNWVETWEKHSFKCDRFYLNWREEVPNGEPKYIVVVEEHDETYCSICGAIQ